MRNKKDVDALSQSPERKGNYGHQNRKAYSTSREDFLEIQANKGMGSV